MLHGKILGARSNFWMSQLGKHTRTVKLLLETHSGGTTQLRFSKPKLRTALACYTYLHSKVPKSHGWNSRKSGVGVVRVTSGHRPRDGPWSCSESLVKRRQEQATRLPRSLSPRADLSNMLPELGRSAATSTTSRRSSMPCHLARTHAKQISFDAGLAF